MANAPQRKQKPAKAGAARTVRKGVGRDASTGQFIQMRTNPETHGLLNRAAALRGLNLTQFVLQAARIEAETVLLEQSRFTLSEADWNRLNEALENPPKPNDELKALMNRKPAWED